MMLQLFVVASLAAQPSPDVIDGQWRAMTVLRASPEKYRIIEEPIVIDNGPVVLTLNSGVMIPVFSGFTDRDREGRRQAKAEAWELDSKSPPPLQEGDVQFVGFVFAQAEGTYEVKWQERADNLVFANHMVTQVKRPREEWLAVAQGESWTGEVTEGWVLSLDEGVRKSFLGPNDKSDDPNEIIVYGEKDYSAARLRARILFHDRREVMKRIGYRPGHHIGRERLRDRYSLGVEGQHTIMDLHIDRNLGDRNRSRMLQPNDVDWLSVLQDWSGTLDSRRHTQVASLDLDSQEALIYDVITGVPFPPSDSDDPFSEPMPPSHMAIEDAYARVLAIPKTSNIAASVTTRLKLRAVGADFNLFQLYIARAGSQHDWRLKSIRTSDGVDLLSKSPLIELNPFGETPAGAEGQARRQGPNTVNLEEGQMLDAGTYVIGELGGTIADTNRNRSEARVTLALPETLPAGESLVIDVVWEDAWPYGQWTESARSTAGNEDGPTGVGLTTNLAPSSGAMAVIPRPGSSTPDFATTYQVQVGVTRYSDLQVALPGDGVTESESPEFRVYYSAQREHPVPFADVHVGAFAVHDEPAARGLPTIRTRTFSSRDGQKLAAESRAQINFLQGYLPPFPWEEHEIALTPGRLNQLAFGAGHGMTAASVTGVDSVFAGGAMTRSSGKHTTQHWMMHELAHQWYGQSLRPAHSSDAWIHEAVAETYALQYVDALYSSRDRVMRARRIPIESMFSDPVTRLCLLEAYDSPRQQTLLYQYGPYVLDHMLRSRIGDQAYFSALDVLAREHAHSPLTTERLQHFFEQASETDLSDFFDFFIYGGFIPRRLALTWSWDGAAWTGTIETDVPFGVFDVPVVVDGEPYWITVENGSGSLTVDLPSEPADVDLDPEHQVMSLNRSTKRQR